MKQMIVMLLIILLCFASASVGAADKSEKIRVVRSGSQPTIKGQEEYFSGSVRIDNSFSADEPGRTAGAYVTFEPGARSAWHTHPAGQWLLVTSGKCLVQEAGGNIEEVFPGDSVWIAPDVRHWHGAAPDIAATHLAVIETRNGQGVTWLEKVTDAEYSGNFSKTNQEANSIEIIRAKNRKSGIAAASNFTGTARTDWIFPVKKGARFYGAYVTFEPAARTNWHTHANGQSIIVTMGRGFFQQEGEAALEVREGDFVWIPAEVNHFHAAAPDNVFVTISMSETPEGGKSTDWGGRVTDEQYISATGAQLKTLSEKQQKIPLIAAFTASGDIDRLKGVLAEGLEAGLTVNEIKEILAHMYAYTGFPRSLNAINAFIEVLDKRQAQGVQDTMGREASPVTFGKSRYDYGVEVLAKLRNTTGPAPVARYEEFSPVINTFLKEHLFADLFSRDNLDYLSRELATIGALSNLPGANAQMRSHVGICLNLGVTEEQMRNLFIGMAKYLGKERSDNALTVLRETLAARK